MRKILFAAAAALLLTGPSLAQDFVLEEVPGTYIRGQTRTSIAVPDFSISIGATVPETVELYEVPDVKYRYTVVNDRRVVVDPETRRVLYVIED